MTTWGSVLLDMQTITLSPSVMMYLVWANAGRQSARAVLAIKTARTIHRISAMRRFFAVIKFFKVRIRIPPFT